MGSLDQREYQRLLSFRTGLRRFLKWSATRAAAAGLTPGDDSRAVRLRLTVDGDERLARLTELHLEELRRPAPQLTDLWEGLDS